jgi:hypothetical protein
LTLTPSLSYLSPDGSELATVPYVLGLAHSPGYPLYTWLGFLFGHWLPIGDVAHRINLMSAVMGALAAGSLYWILIRILPQGVPPPLRRAAAALSALLLAFSKTFWAQSLIAEVYAPNAAWIAFTLLALLRWERTRRARDFFLFALLFGLSPGMHISDLGFAPAFIVFILMCLFEPGPSSGESSPPKAAAASGRFRSLLTVAAVGLPGFLIGAAQFLWLPLQSSTLIDRAMLRSAPTTLSGIYNYTLGAFPNFKFAFALTALPDRLVIYLDLLNRQFGLTGIGLGILGLFSLLARRTRHFFLLVGMYLVHIWFFIQYNAFDLDVFFIPVHLIWAMFMAFGVYEFIRSIQFLFHRRAPFGRPCKNKSVPAESTGSAACIHLSGNSNPVSAAAGGPGGSTAPSRRPFRNLPAAAGCVLMLFAGPPLLGNWAANDFSQDTAVNDFYANVWGCLPENSALITQSGVFGYDAFYWQLAYGTRPDVLLPLLPGPDPSSKVLDGRDLYATTRALNGNQGPGALPANLLSRNSWSLPVLFGQQPEESFGRRETLVLYHLLAQPPALLEADPRPQYPLNADFGPVQLIGYDLSSRRVESGDMLSVKFYWKLKTVASIRVETHLGQLSLEQHEIGFGLLARYAELTRLAPGSVIADSYGLVVPSNLDPDTLSLTIQSAGLGNARGTSVDLGPLEVINEKGTMERWLDIAGK